MIMKKYENKKSRAEPHSAPHFGEQRDYWWNRDFLDLMAERWCLRDATTLADIGCGLGHWSRLLFRYLKPDARLVGVDREAEWISQASSLFKQTYPEVPTDKVSFVEGDATRLPLAGDQFDIVTCQTLLMHLPDAEAALTEMVRIAKPGGLVICVEPNNLFNTISFSSLTEELSVEEITRNFEFWLRYQRGKAARGEGNNSVGDLLPGLFAGSSLHDIQVYQCDKPAPIFPPYQSLEQQVFLEKEEEWRERGTGLWDYADLRKNVLAGGGTEEFFKTCWRELERGSAEEAKAIRDRRFHTAGGVMIYLVSGKKRTADDF